MTNTQEIVPKVLQSVGIPKSMSDPTPESSGEVPAPRLPTCADYGLSRIPVNDQAFRKRWLRMDEYCNEVVEMLQAVELWVKHCLTNAKDSPRTLVLAGRIGVGKSTVARRAIRTIGALQVAAWYEGFCPTTITTGAFEWSKLACIGPTERNDQSCWIDAVEAKAALIDDIGTEVDKFKSGGPTENLRLLLEARRESWTIITTNVPPAKWAEVWDRRVEDRLYRHAKTIELTNATSYAGKK